MRCVRCCCCFSLPLLLLLFLSFTSSYSLLLIIIFYFFAVVPLGLHLHPPNPLSFPSKTHLTPPPVISDFLIFFLLLFLPLFFSRFFFAAMLLPSHSIPLPFFALYAFFCLRHSCAAFVFRVYFT